MFLNVKITHISGAQNTLFRSQYRKIKVRLHTRLSYRRRMKRAHNVFHVSHLERYHGPIDQDGRLCVTVDADRTEEQEVIGILDKKTDRCKVYYLVQFEGQSLKDAVWMQNSELK